MADINFLPFPATKKLPFTITPVDDQGNIVLGTYVWTVSDPAVAVVEVAADTLSAFLVPAAPGTVTLAVTNGDLTDTATGSILQAAITLNLAAGSPVAK